MSNNSSESETAVRSLNRNVSQGMRDLARAGNYRNLWLVIGVILGLDGGLYNLVRQSLRAVREARIEDEAAKAERLKNPGRGGD